MLYLSTAIGLTPGGSGTVHIYTQTIHNIYIMGDRGGTVVKVLCYKSESIPDGVTGIFH